MRSTASTLIKLGAAALFIRLVLLGAPELLVQEAYYWNYAKNLDWGYLDHPPMVGWLIALSTKIFGHSEFSVRLPAFLLFGITAFFQFHLAKALFDSKTAWSALAILSLLPYFFGVGFYISPDVGLVAAWSAALFFAHQALIAKKNWVSWAGFGVCIGVGMLSKYTIALVGIGAILFCIVDSNSRRWFLKLPPYLGVILTLILFTPVIYWNSQNEWASFMFQGPRRLNAENEFSLHNYLAQLLLMATPVGFFVALGVIGGLRNFSIKPKNPSENLFVRSFFLVPTLVFLVFSLRHETKMIWGGPGFLVLIPYFAAHAIGALPSGLSRFQNILHRSWIPFLAVSLIGFTGYIFYLGVAIPGAGYSRRMNKTVGWESLADHVFTRATEVHQETKVWPLVIGMDKHYTAAELSFYLHANHEAAKLEVTGRCIFALDCLMFEQWRPKSVLGRDAILVARSKSDLEFPEVVLAAKELSPIEEFRATTNGKPSGIYFIRKAKYLSVN